MIIRVVAVLRSSGLGFIAFFLLNNNFHLAPCARPVCPLRRAARLLPPLDRFATE